MGCVKYLTAILFMWFYNAKKLQINKKQIKQTGAFLTNNIFTLVINWQWNLNEKSTEYTDERIDIASPDQFNNLHQPG